MIKIIIASFIKSSVVISQQNPEEFKLWNLLLTPQYNGSF